MPKTINKDPIFIFFHMCNQGQEWKTIILEQIELIISSKLYDNCVKIYYGCSCLDCDSQLHALLSSYSKMEKLPIQNMGSFENETISQIIAFSKSRESNAHILYMHSKGITGKSPNQNYWRDFMMAYMVRLWDVSVNILNNGYNTSGVNSNKYSQHYSGNFWWARSDYLRRLEPVATADLNNRYLAETKIMELKEKNKHVNIGTEVWGCLYYIGLYSKMSIDYTDDYLTHNNHMKDTDSIPISIF